MEDRDIRRLNGQTPEEQEQDYRDEMMRQERFVPAELPTEDKGLLSEVVHMEPLGRGTAWERSVREAGNRLTARLQELTEQLATHPNLAGFHGENYMPLRGKDLVRFLRSIVRGAQQENRLNNHEALKCSIWLAETILKRLGK